MAKFLLSLPYPPAQRRSVTNELSQRARNGFSLFHIEGDNQPTGINVCGDCHRMPFLVSTNTPGSGMDAPTWRGANDRFLILPQGRLNIIEFDFYRRVAEAGRRQAWVVPDSLVRASGGTVSGRVRLFLARTSFRNRSRRSS